MCLHAQLRNRSGVRILDRENSWRGEKRGKNREKRQECAASLEAPSSAASQSCQGPGILSSRQEKLWRGQPAELPSPAIPSPSHSLLPPSGHFWVPFSSWCHQNPGAGTLSSVASASLAFPPRSQRGKSQEELTAAGSDSSQPWGHPRLCSRVPASTHTSVSVATRQYLPWLS